MESEMATGAGYSFLGKDRIKPDKLNLCPWFSLFNRPVVKSDVYFSFKPNQPSQKLSNPNSSSTS